MDALIIRPAEARDVAEIAAIYREAVLTGTASFEIEPPDAGEMSQRLATVTGGGYPWLVAERDGRVMGYAYASSYRPRIAYRFSVENSVYVAEDAQRGGIGRALLEALITETAARGFRQMIAVIGDSRQWASIALHRAAGFTFCGTIHAVGYKFDRWLDSVIMQRALGDGDGTPPRD